MNSETTVELNLNHSARAYDRASILPRRILMGCFLALGAAMLTAGVFVHFPSSTAEQAEVLLVVLGLTVIGACAWGLSRIPRAALGITIDGVGIKARALGGKSYQVSWTDRDARIRIYDWTSVPSNGRSRGLQGISYILAPGLPVEAPVTREAVDSIIHQAKEHGLQVEGWSDSPPAPGRIGTIRVSGPK